METQRKIEVKKDKRRNRNVKNKGNENKNKERQGKITVYLDLMKTKRMVETLSTGTLFLYFI